MNIIKIKKLQALKIYNKADHFLVYNLTFYSFSALICCLLCLYPLWFPSMKHFLYVHLPNAFSLFINPKCLFIVGNIIILVLVRESRVLSSIPSLVITKTCDDHGYVENSRKSITRSRCSSILEDDKTEEKESMIDQGHGRENYKTSCDVEQVENKENVLVEEEEVHDLEEDLPAQEELTRRFEDFIARVNRQRWIEANIFDKCSN